VFAAVAAAGCGKKAPPYYAVHAPPERIADLTAVASDGPPLLQWTGNWDPSSVHFRILRSVLLPGDCIDCPHEFIVIEKAVRGESTRVKEKEGLWQYRDVSADSARAYVYRVIVCNVEGQCSDGSNIVEVKGEERNDGK
jgi:hypothetical protein